LIANVLLVLSLLALIYTFAISVVEWKRKWGKGLSWAEWWYSDRTERLALITAALIACYAGTAVLGW
jgi:hypothetical protein